MKIIKIIVVCFSFLLIGCQKETPQYVEDDTLIQKGLPEIELRGNNEFKEEEVETYLSDYVEKQPTILLNNVRKIVVCNDTEYNKIADSKTSIAFADPNDMIVYTRIDIYKGALTHELVHIFDYVQGYHYYSESSEFLALYEKYKGTFHLYNNEKDEYSKEKLDKYDVYFNKDSSEFFAEVSQLYFNEEAYLKTSSLEIYDYLSKLYHA